MKTQTASEAPSTVTVAYWTPAELAERLRITKNTLATWRCLDQGPAYIKVGTAVRYAIEDVLAWELSNRIGAE